MTLRDVRVRKRLHELDRSKASYPTVVRTGDRNRSGKFPLVFDDTNTVVFSATASISYPTTLTTGSKYLTSDLRSDIVVIGSGSVNRDAVDPWLVRAYESEPYVGFDESGRFTFDGGTSEFFNTGSSYSDVGLGFSSGLSSKTIITIELPLSTVLPMLINTASTYYYDDNVRQFSLVASSSGGRRGFGTNPANAVSSGVARLPFYYGTLFSPVGTYSSEIGTSITATSYYGRNLTLIKDVFFRNLGGSIITGSSTNPSSTQALKMSRFINQPFLLEKCVVEFPFGANAGWFSDRTRFSAINDNSIDSRFSTDFGGPAITFGLLNYLGQNDVKDIIAAGTIVPDFDNVNALCLNQIRNSSDVLQTTIRTPEGFRSFADPTLVVQRRPGESNFTGSIRLQLEASASCGVGTIYSTENNGTFGFANYFSASFERSTLFLQNIVGRSKRNDLSFATGRSILGKTLNVPRVTSIACRNHDLYVASGTSSTIEDFVYYSTQSEKKSPYLLFPNDNLVIALSKYRPAWISASNGSSPNPLSPVSNLAQLLPTTNSSLWHYPSSSHAPVIGSGTLRLTLYGSLIKEAVEHHDTLNSRLDTNQIHEAIGMEPIVDEFEVFYRGELAGSNLDQLKILRAVPYLGYGSQFAVTGVGGRGMNATVYSNTFDQDIANDTQLSTQFLFTAARKLAEIRKIPRHIVVTSKELFWDCRVPDPKQVCLIGNPNFRLEGNDLASTVTALRHIYAGSTSDQGASSGFGAGDWWMTYPYDPTKYSSTRYVFSNSLYGDFFKYKLNGVAGEKGPKFFTYESMCVELGTDGIASEYDSTLNQTVGMGMSEFIKVFYGTGTARDAVANRHAKFRTRVAPGVELWSCVDIRGWKYGMLSGFPTYTTAAFRRNKFGQMRDMLEQRLDGKFYNEGEIGPVQSVFDSVVRVKFVNDSGDAVEPYQTFSSNLSLEATSSIPYMDGVVRNREEPITFAIANQSIVVI